MWPMYNCNTRQDTTQEVSILQEAHKLYQGRRVPSILNRDVYGIKSPQTKQPDETQEQLRMRSWGNPVLNMETSRHRTTPTGTRRSVKAMKNLLPLKLSSPILQHARSPSPVPSRNSNSGTPFTPPTLCRVPLPILPQGADGNDRSLIQTPTKLRSHQHRDTPYFTPRPNVACFIDNVPCLSCPPTGSPCDESCIFQDYANLDSSVSNSDSDFENTGCHQGLGFEFWERDPYPVSQERLQTHGSELSLDRQGNSNTYETSMFSNELAWLNSHSPLMNTWKSKKLPQLPPKRASIDPDPEGWLSDSSNDNDEDKNELGCATALSLPISVAPAKAHVVDVSVHPPSPTLSVKDLSSSPLGLEAGRQSRMTFRESTPPEPQWPLASSYCSWQHGNDTSVPRYEPTYQSPSIPGGFDLARTSPPLSPAGVFGLDTPLSLAKNHQQLTDGLHNSESFWSFSSKAENLGSPNGLLYSIVSTLEDAVLSFPSVMLLPDAQCMPAIRSHLCQSSAGVGQSISTTSTYPYQVDWRPEKTPDTGQHQLVSESNPHRSVSQFTLSTIRKFSASKFQPKPNINAPQYELFSAPRFSIRNGDRTIHAVFPKSTPFHRAAAYSHILAYIFLDTLTSPRSDPQRSDAPKMFSSTLHTLPSKVVKVLGAPPTSTRPARVDIRDGHAVFAEGSNGVDMDRVELLLGRTKDCINWLLSEMENPNMGDTARGEVALNTVVFRALVEIVKGCEQNLSAYV